MSKKITFKIVTPTGISYEGPVDSVIADTTSGQVTILPEHTPLFSVLEAGEVYVKVDGKQESFAVIGGFLDVRPGSTVSVIADGAEGMETLDESVIEEAIARGEELKKQKETMSDMEYARVAAALEKDLAKLRALRKKRH